MTPAATLLETADRLVCIAQELRSTGSFLDSENACLMEHVAGELRRRAREAPPPLAEPQPGTCVHCDEVDAAPPCGACGEPVCEVCEVNHYGRDGSLPSCDARGCGR